MYTFSFEGFPKGGINKVHVIICIHANVIKYNMWFTAFTGKVYLCLGDYGHSSNYLSLIGDLFFGPCNIWQSLLVL